MELCWKAWRESQRRFAWALAGLVTLVAAVILMSPGFRSGYAVQYPTDPLPYAKYVWLALFNFYFQAAWIFAAVLLGLGGLTREERDGTVSYTLGLPIARSALLSSRFAVGLVESATFAGLVVEDIQKLKEDHPRHLFVVKPMSPNRLIHPHRRRLVEVIGGRQ